MAHQESFEEIIKACSSITCSDPLDAAAKTALISSVESSAKTALNTAGLIDAETSLAVTINDPESPGPDPIVMWFDYEQPTGTARRCRCPLTPGILLLVGDDQTF